MRACSACGEEKSLVDFPSQRTRTGKVYPHSHCRACRRSQCRTWSKTDRGKQVKRAGVLRREYGITEEEYQRQHTAQGGLCVICRQPETKMLHGGIMRLSVDHNHATGKVRKLLCQACNVGLGSFKDDPVLLRAAADYLESD